MKKMMMSALALCAAVFATAQEEQIFKPFKVDVAIGYAIPGGSGSKGGVLFAIEPKYAINDAIAVGLRMEAALVARVTSNSSTIESADVKAAFSYLATGDYYFNTNSLRPFAGAGVGIYTVANASEDANGGEAVGVGNKFGGMVRAGIETGHFRAALEYNAVGNTNIYGVDGNGSPMTSKSSNGYIGIKIGFFFGGGRL